MRKHTQNAYLDIILLIGMIGLIFTGVILHFILPPGSHQNTFIDLSRHEWGELHFWVAAIFTILIVIHLILHSKWIAGSYFKIKKR
jgi:cytochrome b561